MKRALALLVASVLAGCGGQVDEAPEGDGDEAPPTAVTMLDRCRYERQWTVEAVTLITQCLDGDRLVAGSCSRGTPIRQGDVFACQSDEKAATTARVVCLRAACVP